MKRSTISISCINAGVVAVAVTWTCNVHAEDAAELSHLAQNPIAKLVSVPTQNNLTFGVGPDDGRVDVLNLEPVVPFNIGDNWNVISRTIIPFVHAPSLASGMDSLDGRGDVSLSLYVSPAKAGSLIWGVGPSFTFDTATDDALGQGKFSAGVSAVGLTIRGHWLIGALVTDVASVAGPSDRKDVHQMLVQPFINYNLPGGWYLASSPIITADWKARGGDQWTVPLGGGAGRTFKIGKQAFNAYVQAFGNVVRPDDAGDWTLRAQISLLFPK
jgi:hypothetical protein